MGIRSRIGLLLGPLLFALVLLGPRPEGMSHEMQRVAAVAALMAAWWICEVVPFAATALLPVVLFPPLGVMKPQPAAAPYANHLIFLFLGGFLIAVTMERWNLHRRIALFTIGLVGGGRARIVLGFMLAAAFLSMWISNTATAMMMVPIGAAVIRHAAECEAQRAQRDGGPAAQPPPSADFGPALMLGIAYACSIGGVATLIGTPPNVILAGFFERTYGYSISFASWMAFGLPLAAVMLALTWVYLTRFAFRLRGGPALEDGMACIEEEARLLGKISAPEKRVLAVFLTVAVCWIGRGFVPAAREAIADSTIAVAGALALFLIPAGGGRGGSLLDWQTAARIPWDVIILFGGGLSLAAGFTESGLDRWIGSHLMIMQGVDHLVLIAAVVLLAIFLTEMTSNTATAAMLIPVTAGMAVSMAVHPLGPVTAACLAASYAFMLPVATPPNAVVFGSRQVTMIQMVRAGLAMNILGWLVITFFVTRLLPLVWRIDLHSLPEWIGGGQG